jgi:membrane protein involved in colicin uptake
MAEKDSSAFVSIDALLKDQKEIEEKEKREAEERVRAEEQARLDEIKRQQDQLAARLKAEEEERQRKEHEEQRHKADIAAQHEATVLKAKMEVDAKARLAEMNASAKHAADLEAIKQDKGKKRLTMIAGGLVALVVVGAGVGLYVYKQATDKEAAIEARIHDLEDEKAKADEETRKMKLELSRATDPAEIAALKDKVAAAEQHTKELEGKINQGKNGPAPGGPVKPPPSTNSKTGTAHACDPHDPLCDQTQ